MDDIIIADDWYNSFNSGTLNTPIIVDESENLSGNGFFNGFLINKNNVQPITQPLNYMVNTGGNNYQQLGVESYTVPNGKLLIITQAYRKIKVNNFTMGEHNNYWNANNESNFGIPLLLKSGDVVTSGDTWIPKYSFNGYLVDEDYFENCGGGGSSSSNANTG